jgi:glycerol-3-phosphate dehydrogenase (NAD(P)+)
MRMDTTSKVAVVGGGSWGTALALLIARKGFPVTQWARDKNLIGEIGERRENPIYLPGFRYPQSLTATADLGEAVSGARFVLSVTPSHTVRDVMGRCARQLHPEAIVISASKGIEQDSLCLMAEVLREVLPTAIGRRIAFLAGPSFAKEVAQERPTAVVVAAEDDRISNALQELFTTNRFRVYTTQDCVGAELGGALKNVIAIAAGISDGMSLGTNARAAVITRGIAEIGRLATKRGGELLTLAGLAGIGDLILTCTGDLSRNRQVGIRLGQGQTLAEILGSMRQVAEGVKTAKSAMQLARRAGVEMPITEQVYSILYEEAPVASALENLMGREVKREFE